MEKKDINRIHEFFKDINLNTITKKELQIKKGEFAKKYHLKKLPLTSDILLALNINKPTETFVTKPNRTLSGVTIIAVMTKPYKCPGKCTYCPTFKNIPKSYTGYEPASMRGKINNYDPYKQIKSRIKQLENTGHPTNKIELIVMGGTFPATPIKYQKQFMIKIYQAITDSKSKNLNYLQKKAIYSKRRIVGLTFETRPDYCNKQIIKRLRSYGATRIEIGVQTTHDEIHKITNRGHGIKEIKEATQLLKDSGFKVLYHMMLGLPGSNYEKDLESFKEIFTNQEYCPDMLKIYPCAVIENSQLEKMYRAGEYKPYTINEMVSLIVDIKKIVPKWIRIMRIQRDIPTTKIIDGTKYNNIRQFVQNELKKQGKKCNCIRCSEPHKNIKINKYVIKKIKYTASNGTEYFIYAEGEGYLLGFIRLRFPYKPFIKQINKKTAIVRELHVYGQTTEFTEKNIQHIGIGKKLLKTAEEIAKKNNYEKITVISGIGVREYFIKQKYYLDGTYMSKKI